MPKKSKEEYNEYMRVYMSRRYEQRRNRAIEMLGGECVICGSTENLELDHIDRSLKIFDFAKIWNYKLEFFDRELEKAQLLCNPHHKEKSSAELSVPHGGGRAGKRNCSCDPCKKKMAEYMREYHRIRREMKNLI